MDRDQLFFIVNMGKDDVRGSVVYTYPASDAEKFSKSFDEMLSTRTEFARTEHQQSLYEVNMKELFDYSPSMALVLPYYKALLDMAPYELYANTMQSPRFKMVCLYILQ